MSSDRRDAVLRRVREQADALLVTAPSNVRYLTGFTGSNAQLLLADEPVFCTDGRYTEQASIEVPDLEHRIYPGARLVPTVAELVTERGIRRLGVEAAHTTLQAYENLRAGVADAELVATSELVEEARAAKDPGEVERIRRAQRIGERALWDTLAGRSARAPGTERELALALEWAMRTGGAEAVSFDVIVASGAHAALPHAMPRDEPVEADGVLLIDLGARVQGYCSDMTRTFLGPQAPDELRRAHASVVRAVEAACAVVRPGASAGDVDRAARETLEADGLGDSFIHSTGHGVGLEIHEGPRLAPEAEGRLEEGMVITIEPGVYLPGTGGIRVEDLIVVGGDGPVVLTDLPRGPDYPAER